MLLIVNSIIIGVLSTIFMDVVAWLREKICQITPLNYAFIGRWCLSWKDGQFIHKNITQSPSRKFEAVIGWCIHYFIGIFWAYLYLILNLYYSFESFFAYTLIFSLCTTFAPFLIVQPALGFGFFATNTPAPLVSIKNSLIAHAFFGLGLYLSYTLI